MTPRKKTSFPPVRACIFDMDGLLIDSEDMITVSTNMILQKYGRPILTSSIRARLMGVPKSTNSETFHNWAKLPISREQFAQESAAEMQRCFENCQPLRGAQSLLHNLASARSTISKSPVELALATSSLTDAYKIKTSQPETKELLASFSPERRILGDDTRISKGRGKPAPDVYLLALQALNDTRKPGTDPIAPSECLAFEDSVAGVEAVRRAGMRAVWVPHPSLIDEYHAQIKDILAGRTAMFDIGDDWQRGSIDDGWAELIGSLEDFDFEKYGIEILRGNDDTRNSIIQ